VLAVLSAASPEAAAEPNPYSIGASQTYSHDSNLLRLPDGQDAPAGFSRSDVLSSTALLGGVDQLIGRQRVFGNLNVRANRFRSNPRYDNSSYSAQAGLDWSTVGRVSGSLTVNANRALQAFTADTFNIVRSTNQETSRSVNAGLTVGLVTLYSLELGLGGLQLQNSSPEAVVKARDFNQANASIGLRLRPSVASSFGISWQAVEGRYPKYRTDAQGEYQPDRFHSTSPVLTASWAPTGASSLDLRLGRSSTRFDLNQQRDFSGTTGSLVAGWRPTGKTQLTLAYSRDTGQDAYARLTLLFNQPTSLDYSRLTSSLRLLAAHELSAKLSLTASLTRTRRDLTQSLNDPLLPINATGHDATQVLAVGARWNPRRFAVLGCDATQEKRRADGVLTYSYGNRSFSCFGQITLQ
jgi:hypothetical protein